MVGSTFRRACGIQEVIDLLVLVRRLHRGHIGDRGRNVVGVEETIGNRGQAALTHARGHPGSLVDLGQERSDCVVVPGRLAKVQRGPVQRVGNRFPEEAMLHGHLIGVQEVGGLADAIVGFAVAVRDEDRRAVETAMANERSLKKASLTRIVMIDGLADPGSSNRRREPGHAD